jgi:hypothetical protein
MKKKPDNYTIHPARFPWDQRHQKDEAFYLQMISHLQYKQRLKDIYVKVDGELLGDLMNPNIPWFMKAIMAGKFVVRKRSTYHKKHE